MINNRGVKLTVGFFLLAFLLYMAFWPKERATQTQTRWMLRGQTRWMLRGYAWPSLQKRVRTTTELSGRGQATLWSFLPWFGLRTKTSSLTAGEMKFRYLRIRVRPTRCGLKAMEPMDRKEGSVRTQMFSCVYPEQADPHRDLREGVMKGSRPL